MQVMAPRRGVLVFALVICFLRPACSRVTKGQVSMNSLDGEGPAWRFLGKFSFGLGASEATFRVRFATPALSTSEKFITIGHELLIDTQWRDVESSQDHCTRRKTMERVAAQFLDVPRDGSWSQHTSVKINQNVRPHVWFFSLSDCDGKLGESPVLLDYEFKATQADGSHFSYEHRFSLAIHICSLVASVCVLVRLVKKAIIYYKLAGRLPPVPKMLASAMVLQFFGQLFHTVHLRAFSQDGIGDPFFDAIAEGIAMLSKAIISALLIVVGQGYTVTQSKLGSLLAMVPIGGLLALMHGLLALAGKWQGEQHFKFHEYEGSHGWILFALRLFFLLWFLLAVKGTSKAAKAKVKEFFSSYIIMGSAYFAIFPVVFLAVRPFAPYLQQLVFTLLLQLTQVGSNLWLTSLFLEKNAYYAVSSFSTSHLPGGVGQKRKSWDSADEEASWWARLGLSSASPGEDRKTK